MPVYNCQDNRFFVRKKDCLIARQSRKDRLRNQSISIIIWLSWL